MGVVYRFFLEIEAEESYVSPECIERSAFRSARCLYDLDARNSAVKLKIIERHRCIGEISGGGL